MKPTIEYLKDSFKIDYEAFESSRREASQVWDLYHNRHYTAEQLAILAQRGQPAETFNVVKMFARMLVGYYSTVVNTVVVQPANPRDITTASVLNDTINYVFDDNRFDIEGDEIKLGGLVSGLLCSYTNVEKTGEGDQFNRPLYRTNVHSVPDNEIILDANSTKDDYSDAVRLHRFKWLSKDQVIKAFGNESVEKLDAYHNFLNEEDTEFEYNYGESFTGYFKVYDNFLIVHTVTEDTDGRRWSTFWSDEVKLQESEITYQDTKWPYRVQKLQSSDKTEYYGIFREVIEPQKALNQAVLQIQLMVNSEKVMVESDAVENIDDFATAYNRVNAVIPVVNLQGVRLDKLSREIAEQYTIIDNALNRIQRVLGINDSFLGMAFASDSGRKVKLQQNQTVMSLRYITARIEAFYRSLGEDIGNLVKQYYTATQILAITDDYTGQRWVELNKPIMEGNEPVLIPETDPATGDLAKDDFGNIIMAPVSEEDSDLAFTEFQIKIVSSSYNDEDEKSQLLLETVMSGSVGTMMSKVNPAGFFQMAGLSMKSMSTKHSPEIAKILEQTAAMLQQSPEAQQGASEMAAGGTGQQPLSKSLKLPQNTNEGVA